MNPISEKRMTHLGKFLAYVLRHKPEAAGLTLDAQGWAPLGDLLTNKSEPMTLNEVQQVCDNDDKGRYALDIAQNRIRANQGHTQHVDLGLSPITPPDKLYHGTPADIAAIILSVGLKPQLRQHVHLSGDMETATKVGQRRAKKPTILVIDAKQMVVDGLHIYKSENGVYLADSVLSKYISILAQ